MKRIAKQLARPMAEFVTIVTGVLVALAVDAYAEGRNDRQLEQSYLTRLEEELRSDSVRIQGGLQFLSRADSALNELARLRAGHEPSDPERLISGLISARVRGLPGSLSQSTFDDLQSTGAIRMIRDPRVRVELASHYAGIARRRSQLDTDYTHFPLAISEAMPGAIQRMLLLGQPAPDSLVRKTIRLLAAQPGLEAHINSKTAYAALQRYFLQETKSSGDNLLVTIRAARLALGERK
jgi:hypothetical protein